MLYLGTVLGGKHEQQEERSEPMELVYMDGKKEPYTLSSIVAECTGLQHHTITKTIRKHQERFERFGKVGFKIQAMDSGQNTKDYILNEQQATLLVTFLKNTEQVANFKTNLVKAFFEMRDELSKRQLQRELEKPKRKSLTDTQLFSKSNLVHCLLTVDFKTLFSSP